MIKKGRIAVLAVLASIMLTTAPLMFLVQGQIQVASAEKLVALAERAGQQVQNLIDIIYANETALEEIKDVGLIGYLEGNLTLYETNGLNALAFAIDALDSNDYEAAADYALDALKFFREVYSSIHAVLEAAGLRKGHLIDNQGLLEAITRELQRIERLKEILPDYVPKEILDELETAEEFLTEARTLLLQGNVDEAMSLFLEAKVHFLEAYQYLKSEAEESNAWRLHNYCEGLQTRMQEGFRYCRQRGIDFADALQSLGYRSEAQFMETLQNRIQTALNEQNFGEAIRICQEISQMFQQMNQTLSEEIRRHQDQRGEGGSGSGSGSGGSASGSSGSGSGDETSESGSGAGSEGSGASASGTSGLTGSDANNSSFGSGSGSDSNSTNSRSGSGIRRK